MSFSLKWKIFSVSWKRKDNKFISQILKDRDYKELCRNFRSKNQNEKKNKKVEEFCIRILMSQLCGV